MSDKFPIERQIDLTQQQCRLVGNEEVVKVIGNNLQILLNTHEKFFDNHGRDDVEAAFFENIMPVLKEYSFNDIFGRCYKYNQVPNDFLPYYDYILIVDERGQFDYGTVQYSKKYFWDEGYQAPKRAYMFNSNNEEIGIIKDVGSNGKKKFKKVLPRNLYYQFYKKQYTHIESPSKESIPKESGVEFIVGKNVLLSDSYIQKNIGNEVYKGKAFTIKGKTATGSFIIYNEELDVKLTVSSYYLQKQLSKQ